MSNYWGGHVLIDPKDMENMFTYSDVEIPSVSEELPRESLKDLSRLNELLEYIPAREADFLELFFILQVRQTSIAELFNVSQPTVCYRLSRGIARVKFLLTLPQMTLGELEAELRGVFTCETDIRLMLHMAKTTCQSETARELGVTQGFVRYRFLRSIDRLKTMRGTEPLVDWFEKVAASPNILYDNCRFSWREEIIYSLC
jgi:predicted transcriptional regulator